MLEQTLERVSDTEMFLPATIVGAVDQADEIKAVAPTIELILEPKPCGSAAAVAFAAFAVPGDTVLLVLPSDHHIADRAPLIEAIRRGAYAAKAGRLVTFGIKPVRAETGYGYITAGGALGTGVREAISFIEKPDAARASELVQSGDAFWNSGMFMFSAETFLEELRKHAPEIYGAAQSAMAAASKEAYRTWPDGGALDDCPSISIDYAVMERSDRIAVVPIELDWSDVGTWAAVYDLSAKNSEGNVVSEGSHVIDGHGCLVRSEGPRVVAIGVEDLVVIATPEEVLIVPRSEAQRVREAADIAGKRSR